MENFKEVTFEANWSETSAELDFKDRYKINPTKEQLEKFIESDLQRVIVSQMIDSNLFEIERINDENNHKLILKCYFKQND